MRYRSLPCVQGKPYMVPGSLDARKYQWFDMDWPVRPKASQELQIVGPART